jgi:hypothetical protein
MILPQRKRMITNHTTYLVLFLTLLTFLCNCVCRAQNSSSQEVNAGAAIFAPLRLMKLADLNFGGIVQGPNGGNVIMSDRGSRIFPDDPLGPAAYNGSSAIAKTGSMAASFIVTGEPSNTYSITTPVTLVVSDGEHAMMITLGKPVGPNVSSDGTTAKLSTEGTDAWKIGGTLAVGAGQPSGLYSGSFTEIITYE